LPGPAIGLLRSPSVRGTKPTWPAWSARSGLWGRTEVGFRGRRSRRAEPEEHRRADPGVFARSRQPAQAKPEAAWTSPHLSIVVLPFVNLGGDPEQEYFVDGVTESLTTDLSRISGSFVIARNTAFTYKGKHVDVKQVGRELGVRYVLEGSVQRGGNRMRVNVQLIDTQTGNHIWAERFDKPLADLFDMQDEIVARLASQLGTQLIAAEARRAEHLPHPDSMDLYFQGMACANKGSTPGIHDPSARQLRTCARARCPAILITGSHRPSRAGTHLLRESWRPLSAGPISTASHPAF
jgi:TolB-like protein